MTTVPPLDRFLSKVDKTDSCWLWTAAVSHNGYGFFKLHPIMVKAHRWSYEHFVGPIPDGMLVLHSCDVPRCVNPDHLFLGTQKQNIADMMQKGRDPDRTLNVKHLQKAINVLAENPELRARGERQALAKLTEAQVREIRALYAAGMGTMEAIGRRFGVGLSATSSIIRRKTWKHVE